MSELRGLKERRTFRRHSQGEAGAVIGVNQSHYRRIETGQVRLDIDRAKKLADWLECSIEDLF